MGIYNSLPIVARALSSQIGLNVSVGGSEAYATETSAGYLINLPFFKDADFIADPLLGYAVHEAAHIRFTDFGELNKFIKKQTASSTYNIEVLRHLVNICEDLRIERAMSRRYPGMSKYLNSLNKFLFSEEASACDKPSVVYLQTLLVCGFNRFHGLSIPTKQTREDFERIFGLELYDKAMMVMADSVQADSVKKVFEVACRLYDLAVDAFNETQEPQDPPQDDNHNPEHEEPAGEDNTSDSSQVPESNGNDDTAGCEDGQPGNADHNDSSSSQSADPGNPPSNAVSNQVDDMSTGGLSQADSVAGSEQPTSCDPFDGTTANDLSEVGLNSSDKLNELIKDKVSPQQRVVAPSPFSVAPAKRHNTGNESVSLGIRMATGLRQSLHGLLQGVRAVRRTHRDTGRKLDSNLVTSALLGNTRLFKHKSKAVDVSSAFTILLDTSGSMRRSVTEAEAAVVSVLYALEGMPGVTTSAYHFPHATQNNVGLLKGREQALRAAVGANQFGVETSGCTPLSESLWPALADLTSAKADRHVLFIATDGQPDDIASAQAMIQSAKDDNICVIGIGFGEANDSLMRRLFGETGIAVSSVSSLRSKLLEVTRKVLMS